MEKEKLPGQSGIEARQAQFSFAPPEEKTYGIDQYGNLITTPPKPFETPASSVKKGERSQANRARDENPGDWQGAKEDLNNRASDTVNKREEG